MCESLIEMRTFQSKYFISCILLALLISTFLESAELDAKPLEIGNINPPHDLALHAEIYEDHEGSLNLVDVGKKWTSGEFRLNQAAVPNYGFTDSVFWVRLHLQNRSAQQQWLLQVDYPMLDFVDLYYRPTGATTWEIKKYGDQLAFDTREIKHRSFIFPLKLNNTGSHEIYLRLQSEGALEFPLYLHTPESLRLSERNENFIIGLFYGFILILSIYNLNLFFFLKDRSYLFYFFYITGYGLLQFILNGMAYEFIWPNWPWWMNRSLTFFIGWTFLWALLFAREFLHIGDTSRFLNSVMLSMVFGMILLMLFSLFSPYRYNIRFSAVLVILFSVVIFVVSSFRFRQGYRPARYFLLAWFMLLIGLSLYALKGYGILPSNFFTEYGLQMGSVVEMSLLSMGLADRIRVSRQARQQAERRALASRRLRERAQLRSSRLEIELLKKNIQPHFLLNSLNATLAWLEENPKNAARLLQALAEELRLILDFSSRKLVSLGEELHLCQTHLILMGLRHDKNFTLEIKGEIDEDEKNPPLILHTLIENGLVHGFKGRDEGVFIFTRIREPEGRVVYRLSNNGSREVNPTRRRGLGLRYIKTRLEESFPGRWELHSGPLTPEGWEVKISVTEQ